MHGAAYQSRAKLVQLLADSGADVDVWNHPNRWKWTPLLIALGYRPATSDLDPTPSLRSKKSCLPPGVRPPTNTLGPHTRTYGPDKQVDKQPRVIKDVEFARTADVSLRLDLYLPRDAQRPPLIVWVHGGAWAPRIEGQRTAAGPGTRWLRGGQRRLPAITGSSIPAQVHDIKAAVRYLRANAQRYGYDARRIAIAGASAGGHLAALVGTTNGHPKLEGTLGDHLDQPSDVGAIVDYYGPTNFMTILDQSTPHGLGVRVPALQLLLRGQPESEPDLAKLASPVFHVDAQDPPLLLIHGDQDPQVPINQSHELSGRYQEHGLPLRFEVIHGGAHGGASFYDRQRLELVRTFLEQHLPPAGD